MLVNEELRALLPEIVIEISDVIGMPSALLLCENLGGLDLSVPKTLHTFVGQQLVSIIGKEKALDFVSYFSGERLYLPRCHKFASAVKQQSFVNDVLSMMETGVSQAQAIKHYAPMYDFSERWAYKILAENKSNQIDLFKDFKDE